jgi:hypothetical protein
MSPVVDNAQWIEAQQKDFQARTGAALAFWPELKRALLDLAEDEPVSSRVSLNASADEPYVFIISAGIFELKFAADVLSDTIFYAFTSPTLKRVMPRESAIFHHGQLKLTRGPWGVIDNHGAEVHKVFIDDPQSVQYLSLADQVARWGLEQLLGGYPKIAALQEPVVKSQEESTKKETKDGSAGHK